MTLQELEDYFANAPHPLMPIYLNAATKVNDYKAFVDSHIQGIKACENPKIKQILIDRLMDFKLLMDVS